MSSYPSYALQPPSSNIPYASVSHAHNNSYPPNGRIEHSATSLDSDSSGEHD